MYLKRPSYQVLALIALMSFARCSEDKSIDEGVREIAELALVEYDVSKIIYAKKVGWLTTQDATFVAKSEATVSLGFDLEKLDSKSIEIDEESIVIHLPKVEVLEFSYPSERMTLLEEYSTDGFINKVSLRERESALREAEKNIRMHIERINLTKMVEQKAKNFLSPFLEGKGFKTIVIKIEDS